MSLVLIQAQVLSASASSVTFSATPQTFKTLKLVISARNDNSGFSQNLYLQFNGSAAANYSWRLLYGYSGTAGSQSGSAQTSMQVGVQTGAGATASTFDSTVIDIPNYAGSMSKAVSADNVSENNSSTLYQDNLVAGLWSNTAAIASITLFPGTSASIVAGSSFYLYGLS